MNKFFIIGQVTKNWRSIKQYAAAVVFFGNLEDEPDTVAVVAGVAFGGFQVWIILQYIAGSHKLLRSGNILKHILQFLVQCLVILLLQKSLHQEQFSLVFVPEKTDLLRHFFKLKNIIAIAVFNFLLEQKPLIFCLVTGGFPDKQEDQKGDDYQQCVGDIQDKHGVHNGTKIDGCNV